LLVVEMDAASTDERIAKLEHTVAEYQKLIRLLQEENERLKRGLLGQKAERLPKNDAQLSLSILGVMLGDSTSPAADQTEPEAEQTIPEHTRSLAVRLD
jgi:hypothetical protein